MHTYLGKVSSLFISSSISKKRVEKENLQLDTLGILSDKYYDTNIQRSILITSIASYTLAKKYGIQMPFGSLGENILIDYNPYHLQAGTQLEIGSTKLEISQNCTICEHLSSIDERLPILLEKDRGIFAKVLVQGVIKKGDKIYLLNKPD